MDKSDLIRLSYAEFGRVLDVLTERVVAFCEAGHPVDLVAPILRSGAVTGLHLASQLGVIRMLPLQYKHAGGDRIDRLLELPVLAAPTSAISTILLVDTNTVRGEIATLAARDLHARYPHAAIHLATAVVDHGLGRIPHVESVISGAISNESRSLDVDEAAARGIPGAVWVFPWESVEDQWREICAVDPGAAKP